MGYTCQENLTTKRASLTLFNIVIVYTVSQVKMSNALEWHPNNQIPYKSLCVNEDDYLIIYTK